MNSFRLAHLSDLHFSHVTLDCKQFFSKRWVGNFNFLLRRRKEFHYPLLDSLPSLLRKQKVQIVLLSGDLTCTSSEAEFQKACQFIEALQKEGLETILLPGNHDHYTKKAYASKIFYRFFPTKYEDSPWSLKDHQIAVKHLQENWWILLLDTTLATPLFCCQGRFSEALEVKLQEVLSTLPPTAQILLANHFPIHGNNKKPEIQREKALLDILEKDPRIKCYLHGHDHQNTILDRRKQGLPISIDAGSATHKEKGSFMILECQEQGVTAIPFFWDKKHTSWMQQNTTHSFTW